MLVFTSNAQVDTVTLSTTCLKRNDAKSLIGTNQMSLMCLLVKATADRSVIVTGGLVETQKLLRHFRHRKVSAPEERSDKRSDRRSDGRASSIALQARAREVFHPGV